MSFNVRIILLRKALVFKQKVQEEFIREGELLEKSQAT